MKIKRSIIAISLLNCLAYLIGGSGAWVRGLTTLESRILRNARTEKENFRILCYTQARLAFARSPATTPDDAFLKDFCLAFETYKGKTLPELIQAATDPETKTNHRYVVVWFIGVYSNDKMQNFKNYYAEKISSLNRMSSAPKPAAEILNTTEGSKPNPPEHPAPVETLTKAASTNARLPKTTTPQLISVPNVGQNRPNPPTKLGYKPQPLKHSTTQPIPRQSTPRYSRSSVRPSTTSLLDDKGFSKADMAKAIAASLHSSAVPKKAAQSLAEMIPITYIIDAFIDPEEFKTHIELLSKNHPTSNDKYEVRTLETFFKDNNLTAIKTPGFGNCAFDAALLAWLYRENLYKPQWNTALGAYLEANMKQFREEVCEIVLERKLTFTQQTLREIAKMNTYVSSETFRPIAARLNSSIILFYLPENKSKVVAALYPADGTFPISGEPVSLMEENRDALLICYNGTNHFMAVRNLQHPSVKILSSPPAQEEYKPNPTK